MTFFRSFAQNNFNNTGYLGFEPVTLVRMKTLHFLYIVLYQIQVGTFREMIRGQMFQLAFEISFILSVKFIFYTIFSFNYRDIINGSVKL